METELIQILDAASRNGMANATANATAPHSTVKFILDQATLVSLFFARGSA